MGLKTAKAETFGCDLWSIKDQDRVAVIGLRQFVAFDSQKPTNKPGFTEKTRN